MDLKQYALQKVKNTKIGTRLVEDLRYRLLARAVVSLTGNLAFALYNGILGILSSSLLFVASSVYYLLLSTMRFSVVLRERKSTGPRDRRSAAAIGLMLMALSIIFQVMVFASMRDQTAAVYGTIPMITIATFTFVKITAAAITAVKHRAAPSPLFKAVNAIRYCEVAVSLLTMQQSMLASFGEENDPSAVILNACTGAGVCLFILVTGLVTFGNSRKETKESGKFKNRESNGPDF